MVSARCHRCSNHAAAFSNALDPFAVCTPRSTGPGGPPLVTSITASPLARQNR